ncbi:MULTISPECIES: IclR family transcriptional regulator [Achromobacter]|uniref:Helix-turn-helix domain-containing protein n=1 Tax=Achromobacter spanius TaxID=217203 RepID=A0ABY8H0Y4_9BURK|nr:MULTISPECIES: helix-turn-helix domain-containing protein [Achromobacter]WAI85794.1 helix-turn-helix domain-containing protein [Achromobacter spanius]WEX95875.1 helix-turn-helix domain-containing protein [Achromobacter sp. SS2-2022]WFP10404.1 helix-turn-helix domain-containing protein [Achromobacter spanius]
MTTRTSEISTDTSAAATQRFDGISQNRSLARGLDILRAFKPGTDLLGNGELAERTGLSAATVSRLTQTLVTSGFLEYERGARAYRLAAPVLSLGHAMRAASPVLNAATPFMQDVSNKLKVNIGLACADRTEMVYLESIRYNRKASLRTIVAGQRVPIELTSLGRAYLATLDARTRQALLEEIMRGYRSASWKPISAEVNKAFEKVAATEVCLASWQPGVVAMSTPLAVPGGQMLALNLSLITDDTASAIERQYGAALLALRDKIVHELERRAPTG